MERDLTPIGGDHDLSDGSIQKDPESENCAKFVSFNLGDNLYAIHAPSVAEVSHPLTVTPLPGSAAELRGISTLRGGILAMVDIKWLVDETSQNSLPKAKTLVLKSINKEDTPIAFDVDKLGEIVALPVNELRPVKGKTDKFLFGESAAKGARYLVVDHTKLLSALA